MIIPEHIGANGVEAAGADHLNTMTPQIARNAGEMHFAAADHERLTVEKERVLTDFKCMLTCNRRGGSRKRG
jgi:predicted lipoprotein with Yx(FWY)xxD motif